MGKENNKAVRSALLLYEAEFKRAKIQFMSSYRSDEIRLREFERPGILREFYKSNFIHITFKDNGQILMIDKNEIDAISLDEEKEKEDVK
jgi:hypothetical protein